MSTSVEEKKPIRSAERSKKAPAFRQIYLELDAVSATIGLAVATIQRLVREGDFPKPRQLSNRRVAWLVREIEDWAEQRPVSNLPAPPNSARAKIDVE